MGDHDSGVFVLDKGCEKVLFVTTNALVSGHAVRQLLNNTHVHMTANTSILSIVRGPKAVAMA